MPPADRIGEFRQPPVPANAEEDYSQGVLSEAIQTVGAARVCEFSVVSLGCERVVPLRDGSCPNCKNQLVIHTHNPSIVGVWMMEHIAPLGGIDEVRRMMPHDNRFGKCMQCGSCWKLDDDRVWHIFDKCCSMLTLRMETENRPLGGSA